MKIGVLIVTFQLIKALELPSAKQACKCRGVRELKFDFDRLRRRRSGRYPCGHGWSYGRRRIGLWNLDDQLSHLSSCYNTFANLCMGIRVILEFFLDLIPFLDIANGLKHGQDNTIFR